MNQAMQSFLLKTTCCILIIIDTFCTGCFSPVCKASCYFNHRGFDFGYCENGSCKCAPPVIYVFNGVGRDLSDEYIHNSLVNDNVIQNSVQISGPSASDTLDKNNKNKIWKDIVEKIISRYPVIKEEYLKDLKAKIFNNISDLNNFSENLQNPLVTALKRLKIHDPSTSKECNDLLNILVKLKIASVSQNVPNKNGATTKLPAASSI